MAYTLFCNDINIQKNEKFSGFKSKKRILKNVSCVKGSKSDISNSYCDGSYFKTK